MADRPPVQQLLAVVGHQHHQRIVQGPASLQLRQQPAQLIVDVADQPPVAQVQVLLDEGQGLRVQARQGRLQGPELVEVTEIPVDRREVLQPLQVGIGGRVGIVGIQEVHLEQPAPRRRLGF